MKNNKSLGQHWLQNREILDQIASLAADDAASQVCLEIGPGLGTLTSSLLRRFDQVIAVEYDANLAANLPKSFPGKKLQVISGDVLDAGTEKVFLGYLGACWRDIAREAREDGPERRDPKNTFSASVSPYVVAGNIPYYITSPIITKFLTINPLPERIVLLIQKEVAERIAAAPGHHTYLSVFVQNYAEVALGPVVKKTEFTPPPKVDSQVIVLTPRPHPLIIPQALKIVKIGFSNPRKKLITNLISGLKLSKQDLQQIFADLGLDPNARPADLAHADWAKLQKTLA